MCGIAGILTEHAGVAGNAQISAMIGALAHRGPDDYGLWSDEICTLGHRRLAIIDLSEAGRQPLSNADGTIWITFNGEIYNFQALRRELEGYGSKFKTGTDTEVIIHAYEKWDIDCLHRLRGQFAFGLWDQTKRRLFLVRDRVGKKPLVYTRHKGEFLFASEIQGLLVVPGLPREIDFEAIDEYLSWGYVPAPRTGFSGIKKLPPGHWLTLEQKSDGGWIENIESYWKLEYGPKLAVDQQEAVEGVRERLTEAVRLRMISDVPLGAFLSGGIDSSIVVGLMVQLSDRPVKTFSIGFKNALWDETAHAKRIAEKWGTDHHQFDVEPHALEVLPKLVRHYGEPFADSSAVPTFYVSQLTRSEVTVALNGDGGDESFAGYERYLGNRLAERIRGVPFTELAARGLSWLLPDSPNPKSPLRRAHRFLSVATDAMPERYGNWIGYFNREAKSRLYAKEFRSNLNGSDPESWMADLFAGASGLDPVDASMAVDVASYLPYDLLVKVDIASMANSLEARSPFLDHEVMEYAARLPVSMKLRGRESKFVLRSAFGDLLPQENVARRKMGFGVPVGDWFRGELKELLKDALLSKQGVSRGYFDSNTVASMVNEHLAGGVDHSARLWNLLMLELWHREFV